MHPHEIALERTINKYRKKYFRAQRDEKRSWVTQVREEYPVLFQHEEKVGLQDRISDKGAPYQEIGVVLRKHEGKISEIQSVKLERKGEKIKFHRQTDVPAFKTKKATSETS